jgi:hypothetical protein
MIASGKIDKMVNFACLSRRRLYAIGAAIMIAVGDNGCHVEGIVF